MLAKFIIFFVVAMTLLGMAVSASIAISALGGLK